MATLVQQMETMQAEIDAATAKVTELTTELEATKKALADSSAILSKSDEAIKAACAETQTALDALKTEQDAHIATQGELQTARLGLANPAFADAAVAGMKAATAEGGSPSTEEPMTKEEAIHVYNKLPDGMEGAKLRAEFRAKHKELLGV